MCLHTFFKSLYFNSRLFSAGIAVVPVLIIFLLGCIKVANGQQRVSQIESLPPPVLGEYRSVKDGDWNKATTWQEWTGTEWTNTSTFPTEISRLTPVVADWNTSTKTDGETKHTVNLPPNIEAGDLILIFWTSAQTGGRGILNGPSRFTQIYSNNSSYRWRIAWFKVATGNEGQTIEITAGIGASAHTSYRIAAGSYTGVPISGTIASGRNSLPDPPALISGFGAVPTLWIASSHSEGNVSAPLDFPPLIAAFTGMDGDAGARTATTHLITTNSVSQNPEPFGLDVNSNWAANTIAIQGALQKAVVQNDHTVTVTNNVTTSDVDVYGILHVNTNIEMTVNGESTLTVQNGGRLRLPGSVIAANDARIAGSGHFILNKDAYLEIGSTNGITSSGINSNHGNIRNSNSGSRIFNAGAHYIYNRTGPGNSNQSTGSGYPNNLTGSLTIDNPGKVTRPLGTNADYNRTITTGVLNLVQGTFETSGSGFTMGDEPYGPNGTIVRTGGFLTGGVGNKWYQVIYEGDSKVAGPELLGTGLRNLTVNLNDKSQVLALNTSATVPGILTLEMGVMNTGSNILTVSNTSTTAISGGSSNSFVQGSLVRGIAAGTNNTYNFPLGSNGRYAPVSLAFASNSTKRNVTGTTTHTNHPNVASSNLKGPKVERNWTLSSAGIGSYNYSPTFRWDNAEEEDGFEYKAAVLARYGGSVWNYPTMLEKTTTSATATRLASFGDFQVGSEHRVPDAIKSSIEADRTSELVANNMDASSIIVKVRDVNGNPIGAGVDVFLRVIGGRIGEGSLHPSGSWKTNVDGEVEVNLTSTVANKVKLIAYLGTDEEGELIGATEENASVEVDFKADLASHLAIITQPAGQVSGSALAIQPTIHLLDAYDNIVTYDNTTEVTVAISSGKGGTLGGSRSVIADSGVVVFNRLTLAGMVGEVYELTFTSEGITEAVSDGVKLISHGSVAQIVLSGLTTNLPSGESRQLTATLKDEAGNRIDTGVESALEILISQSAELGSVSGLSTIRAENGVALITIIGEKAGQVTVETSTLSPALADELTLTITVDKTALQIMVTETVRFFETDWSVDSWAVLQAAIENARAVLDDTNSMQSEINAILAALSTAIAGLAVDKAALQTAVSYTEDFTETDWSVDSWAALQIAVADAQAVLDDTIATQLEINNALDFLNRAVAGLTVDKASLQTAVSATEGFTENDWSVDSWAALQIVVEDAQSVLDDTNSRQSEINGILTKLSVAVANLVVDKAALQTAVSATEGFTETDWSVNSWVALQIAVADAQAVLDNTIATQLEINNALDFLNSAVAGLTVDRAALQAAVTETEDFIESDWSIDSWAALQIVVADAQAVLSDTNSRQSEINGILTKLSVAVANLVVDKAALQTAVSATEGFTETDWSVNSWVALQIAVADAQAFLDNTIATQLEINNTLDFLNSAVAGLTVDRAALQAAVTETEDFIESDWSIDSWAALQIVVADAEALLSDTYSRQSEINSILTKLSVAVAGLEVDKAALQTAVTETQDFIETDWSVDSWAALQIVVEDAQAVLDDTNSRQSEIYAALTELNMALGGLNVDRTSLQAILLIAETKVEFDYSTVSWTKFLTILIDAQAVINDINAVQSEIDAARDLLIAVIASLTVNSTTLKIMVTETENFIESDWSVDSWAALQIVVAHAQAVLDDTNSRQSEINAILAKLSVAVAGLVVDKSALQTAVSATEGFTETHWSVDSWAALQIAVADAQAVLDNTIATQLEINNALDFLNRAVAGLEVDKAALQTAVTETQDFIETDWSIDSWAALQIVVADAQAVLSDTNSRQSEINGILAKLSVAVAGLEVDKAALQTAVTETQDFIETDWSVDSWAALQIVVENAQAVLDDINSRQSEINAALTELNMALNGLSVDRTSLQAVILIAETKVEFDYSTVSWTKFLTILIDAQAVINDINAVQSEIDAARDLLNAVTASLTVDSTTLKIMVTETENFIESDWSVDSWAALQIVVEDAQSVLDDTNSRQSEINGILTKLSVAVANLVVDKAALQTAVSATEGFTETDWSVDSWAALQIAVADAQAVLDDTIATQLEINNALDFLNRAVAGLTVDRAALQAAVTETEDFIESDWSIDSWAALQIVVADAEALLSDTYSRQSEINSILTKLSIAIAGLEVDKAALQSAVSDTEGFTETDWSVDSWAALQIVVENAQAVLDDTIATQLEINNALDFLNRAIAGLTVDRAALQAAVTETEDFIESDWSVDSWTALQIAVADAQAVLSDTNSRQSEINAAFTEVNMALGGLNVDRTSLQAILLIAETKVEFDYSTVSWTKFLTILIDAQAVINDINAVQSEIDAARDLLNAVTARLTVDSTALKIMVTETKDFIESDWSIDSWAALQIVVAHAQAVLEDTNSRQSEINAILAKLSVAVAGLVVDKSALQTAVSGTEGFTETDWSVNSWTALQAEIEEARRVLDNTNAKQSEVYSALAALNNALGELRIDKSALETAIANTSDLSPTYFSQASWADLETAFEAAKAVLADISAGQSQVDSATLALDSALDALQPAPKIGTPTNLVGQAQDKQVSLNWSAPTGEGTVIDYLMEYSIDNGASWHSYNDGPSATAQSTVTGLVNNRAYIFRVAAVSESGLGEYSGASSTIIPTAPVLDESNELPQPGAGEAVMIINSKRGNVTPEVVDNSALRFRDEEFSIDLFSIDVNGVGIHISEINSMIRILRSNGSLIRLKGYGYEPGTYISVYIFSQPILLGQIPVQIDGTFDGRLSFPEDLDLGLYTLQGNGLIRQATVENSLSVGLLVVENTEQQILFEPLPEKVYGDTPFKLNAAASSELSISYRVTGMDGLPTDIVELLDDNMLKINKPGQVKITAIQSGNDIFDAASPITQILLIKPRQVTFIRSPEPLEVLYGTEFNALEKPNTVQITFSDGTKQLIPVIWGKDFYNANRLGNQSLSGSFMLDELSGNKDNIKVELLVIVNENPVFIPNVFTPNGDGVNDVFVIRGLESYDQVDLSVFNRWGNEVYRNADYKNTWDGSNLNEGTYYYKLSMEKGNDVHVHKGWVLIKR